jgi:hypothetical protein
MLKLVVRAGQVGLLWSWCAVAAAGLFGYSNAKECIESEKAALMTRWLSPMVAKQAQEAAAQACWKYTQEEWQNRKDHCIAQCGDFRQDPGYAEYEKQMQNPPLTKPMELPKRADGSPPSLDDYFAARGGMPIYPTPPPRYACYTECMAKSQ